MNKIKKILKDTAYEITIATIIWFISSVGGYFIKLIEPRIFIPYLITVIILMLIGFSFYFYTFGTAKFKWGHIYSFSHRKMTLKADGSAIDEEHLGVIKQKKFHGKVSGCYDWSDVTVKRIEGKSQKSIIKIKYQNQDGKDITKDISNNSVDFSESLPNVCCDIEFPNNCTENSQIITSMEYDKNKMFPIYFSEVNRPIKKLKLELCVQENVRIRNVKEEIVPLFGDEKAICSKELLPIAIKPSESLGLTKYQIIVRNPKLFHKYQIKWEWL